MEIVTSEPAYSIQRFWSYLGASTFPVVAPDGVGDCQDNRSPFCMNHNIRTSLFPAFRINPSQPPSSSQKLPPGGSRLSTVSMFLLGPLMHGLPLCRRPWPSFLPSLVILCAKSVKLMPLCLASRTLYTTIIFSLYHLHQAFLLSIGAGVSFRGNYPSLYTRFEQSVVLEHRSHSSLSI